MPELELDGSAVTPPVQTRRLDSLWNDVERCCGQVKSACSGSERKNRFLRSRSSNILYLCTEAIEGRAVIEALRSSSLLGLIRRALKGEEGSRRALTRSFREALTHIMENSSVVFSAFELVLVAKNLERIAEDVIYFVAGRDIRHPALDRRCARLSFHTRILFVRLRRYT